MGRRVEERPESVTNALPSFGEWVRRRRKALDLTQEQLAQQVGYARVTIKKIEADELQPSKQLASLLAEHFGIPAEERDAFVRFARGVQQPELVTFENTNLAPWRATFYPSPQLPIYLTTFVGRESESVEVRRLLATHRVVTLTGAGGVGKTRLAVQIAAKESEASTFRDGVWLVELAALADPAQVPQAVATALGLHEEPGLPIINTLMNFVREENLLLVLDNCEHLINACAQLVDTLLRTSPNLHILTTSREALGVAGEILFRVPSLSFPRDENPTPDILTKFEATRLFLDRAQAILPAFKLTNDNAASVIRVCQHLDGIPLAIELAAARVKMLSVEQIAARLDDRFKLLTEGMRTVLLRHQTLRATIDWSYDLLMEAERVLLQRLSVFVGGWTLEAAEEVSSRDEIEKAQVLDLLSHLVDKSLVEVDESSPPRYRMLETIRQYAREKLDASSETQAVHDRHLDFYLKLAEDAEPKLRSFKQKVWLDRMETERDNLRAALAWALEKPGAESALRLATALEQFWFVHGHWSEGRRWLEDALARGASAPVSVRARALFSAGYLAVFQDDAQQGASLLEESLGLFQQLGDKRYAAWSLFMLGFNSRRRGNFARAVQLVETSLKLRQEIGDKEGIAFSFHLLGEFARDLGDYNRARTLLEESQTLFREIGNKWGVGVSLMVLAQVARSQGDSTGAKALCEESMNLFRELGDKRSIGWLLGVLGLVAYDEGNYAGARSLLKEALTLRLQVREKTFIAACLEGLAQMERAESQPKRAARLMGAAEMLRETANIPVRPGDRAEYEHNLAALVAAMGEEAFDAAWREGRAMTMEQAIAYAIEERG